MYVLSGIIDLYGDIQTRGKLRVVPGAGIECMVKSLVLYDKNISNKFMYPQEYPQLILL